MRKTGKLKALAVTSAEPSLLAPGVPTVSSSGVVGYESVGTTSMFAPSRTPAAIINRLNQEVVRFLRTAEAKEKFLAGGTEVVGNSPDEAMAFLKADIARKGKLIRDAGIKVN